MTTNYSPFRYATAAALLIAVLLALGTTVGSASDSATIRLQPGYNAVTWNGSEPYPISDFAETPVTRIYRWDAVGQEWLSRFVGRDGGRLPELHLLPRVQYLIVAQATYEIDVPDPIAEIDPYAELRRSARPDDPLRFEAWWPNEDSPLEDLVVLRGDDERLSVRAEIAGGVGDAQVWWMIDGRVNHAGLKSDDVDLTPGAHDYGRLFATDKTGQVAVVELPRIVKLPPLESPTRKTKFGIVAHFNYGENYGSAVEAEAAAKRIKDAGMSIVRTSPSTDLTESERLVEYSGVNVSFDKVLDIVRRHELSVLAIVGFSSPNWASSYDKGRSPYWGGVSRHDTGPAQMHARLIARRWPTQSLFEIGNEPNLSTGGRFIDPVAWAKHHKAVALGIWYENPSAIIVSAGICCFGWGGVTQYMPDRGKDFMYSDGNAFFAVAYQHGMGRYSDIIGIHPNPHLMTFGEANYQVQLRKFFDVMEQYGDGHKPVWVTETSTAPWIEDRHEYADYLVEELRSLSSYPNVEAVIVYNFRDVPPSQESFPAGLVERSYNDGYTFKPQYWSVREYLTGKPPPE